MVNLIGKLCGLCAVSTLLDMMLPDTAMRSGLRLISGLLMLHMTMTQGREIVVQAAGARAIDEFIRILIG